MTNELEKTFFDTFGIEPKRVKRTLELAMQGYDENDLPKDLRQFISSQVQVYHVYPEITDRILLDLIRIRCKELISIIKVKGDNREELRNYILKLCIEDYTFYSKTSEKTYNELANNFKQQVRALFEEEK